MGHAPRFQSVDYPAYTVITGDTTMILSSSLQRGLAALFLAAPVAALAVGPGSGSQSRHNFRVGSCQVSSMQVIYKLDSLMGEPTVSGSYKWTGNGNCSLPSSTTLWLKVQDSSGGAAMYASNRRSPKATAPTAITPPAPGLGRSPVRLQRQPPHQLPAPNGAKNLWKSGRVTDFSVTW
ncbi:hypothetical protein HML84_13675 [Alcanivorax sp. IO_7]|nr:hypothetical protein HML84_13675 [Alcanivorax sp. IO_7]